MILLSKSMTFVRSSRASTRFGAFLINVCFLIGICPKITSKLLPKPSKIHHRSDPEPYQKKYVFLEGLLGALGTNTTVTLHQISLEKGGEKGIIKTKTP